MDTVILKQPSETADSCTNENDLHSNSEIYANAIRDSNFGLKHEIYDIVEHELSVSNEEYQSALTCLNELNDKCASVSKLNFAFDNKQFHSEDDTEKRNNMPIISVKDISILNSTTSFLPPASTLRKDALNAEHTAFSTTDDESMAVEALRQLGGMYTNVVSTEHNLPMLSCNTCEIKFNTLANLQAHILNCKNNIIQTFSCAFCKEMFMDERVMSNHVCSFQEHLKCKYCNKLFFRKMELYKHVQQNHRIDHRLHECSVCHQRFPRPSSLTNHMKIHNYQPGRAVLNIAVNPEPTNIDTNDNLNHWPIEQICMTEVAVETTSVETLPNKWNLNYDENSSIFVKSTQEDDQSIIVTEHFLHNTAETNSLTNIEDIQDSQQIINTEYEAQDGLLPVKVEMLPYMSELDASMNEPFPISSIPQMEVVISTDERKPHLCTYCGMSFSREKALVSHIKMHSINWPTSHECDICGETFSDVQTLNEHKLTCNSNDLNFEQPTEELVKYVSPNREINENKPVKPQVKVGKHPCPECDKHFATKQKMFRHMWIHRKKTYTCELCSTTFEVQSELDRHRLANHPNDSPYVCQECGKCFASRQGLWEHGRVHGSGAAGLFTCTKCSKTFASRQGYLIHNRTHTGERPYGCRFCLKAFRDGGTLRKHERIHTGERPHVCPICLHDFNQKVVLREHVRWVHTANKTENENGMFSCEICNVGVSDREELCAHIVRHSDQMAAEAKYISAKATENVSLKVVPDKSPKKGNKTETNMFIKAEVEPVVADTESNIKEIISRDTILQTQKFNMDKFSDPSSRSVNDIACDLCGIKFSSQKDLMSHVHIHI